MNATSATADSGQQQPEPAAPTKGKTTALLTCLEVEKRLGNNQALNGASLSINPGEIVAITGASGSGKSTLLYCASGILTADAGAVVYDGRAIDRLTDAKRSELRRTEFGFIFQFGRLVPELSCLENVALPLRLSGAGHKDATRRAVEWLDYLEISGLADTMPGDISGGEGQRVAVARALVTNPRVVFADEPTGALDSINGEHVMRLISESARSAGAAVLLVTHEARVAAYADREVVLRDGRTREI